jgi:hypothetical protein
MIKALKKLKKIQISDKQVQIIGTIIGFLMLFYGLRSIYPALAFIIGGIMFMWVFWPGKR